MCGSEKEPDRIIGLKEGAGLQKLIITAALVGAEVMKEDTPHLPVTADEIAAQAEEVREAGASVVHLHVRDENGRPSQDRSLYQ